MAKAIQFFQSGFYFVQGLARCYEIFVPDLAQSREQIVERFGVVDKRRKGSVAQDKLAHRFAAGDPALMMLQVSEERFQIIVGGGHIRDTVTSEQAPPPMAHGFRDVCNDSGILWLFLCLLY